MDLQQAIEYALSKEAILFCGAGFSVGAINVKNEALKSARQLAAYLASNAGLPSNTPLEAAAELYAETHGGAEELISELKREFLIKDVTSSHEAIADIPWRRIYTTNYDQVLERAYTRVGKVLTPVTGDDDIRETQKTNTLCVHFNGYIERLNLKTLYNEFKLTESSYNSASLEGSAWATLLRSDMQRARAVVFLGYSLYDLDFRRILSSAEPSLKDKCLFVIGHAPDAITLRRTAQYGTPLQITVDEFAETARAQRASFRPIEMPSRIGNCVQQFGPPTERQRITDEAAFELLLLGNDLPEHVFHSQYGEYLYFLERTISKTVLEMVLKGHKHVVVHGELGNGKSMFLKGLQTRFYEKGYQIFLFQKHSEHSISELEEVLNVYASGKLVFVIDNYQDWFREVNYLALNASSSTVFILAARTSEHDVHIDKLSKIFQVNNWAEVPIDHLSDTDIDWIVGFLDHYGFWGSLAGQPLERKRKFIKVECCAEFHAVLLKLLESPHIIERFRNIVGDLSNRGAFYKVVLSILILNVIQGDELVSLELLKELWWNVVIGTGFAADPQVRQVIDFERGIVKLRSSVAAQYILRNAADAPSVVDVLIEMAKVSNRNVRISGVYLKLLGSLMKFRNLQWVVPERQRRPEIIRFYESTKNLDWNREYPLFWLQYAIACTTLEDYDRAKKYFETAYSLAAARSDFDAYQIDNHFARFLLQEVTARADYSRAMDAFWQAHAIVGRQTKGSLHMRMHYPYRVAALYAKFYDTFQQQMSNEEIDGIARAAEFILGRIQDLPRARSQHPQIIRGREAMEYILSLATSRLKQRTRGV